eukprot:Gb_14065 [translate_table: standard]
MIDVNQGGFTASTSRKNKSHLPESNNLINGYNSSLVGRPRSSRLATGNTGHCPVNGQSPVHQNPSWCAVGMAEAEPFSFHDTFVGILQQLDMLKHIHLMHTNVVENSSKITNGELTNSREEIAKSNTYIVNTSGEDTKQSSAVSRSNPSFRKRKRKQENDKICRLDIAKAEEEDVLENLKAEECKNFLKYFSLQLPTFVPNEGFVKESANLNDNLEVCKRLAGRAGRLIREKNAVLEEEWRRIGELEDALSKEQKLKEELRNELVVLQERVDAVRTAAREGFEYVGEADNSFVCGLLKATYKLTPKQQ